MARVDRLSSPDISDRSYTIWAEFEPASADAEGMLVAWGSRFAGFALCVKGGELNYEYVYSESVSHTISAPFSPKPGKVAIRLEFRRTGKSAGRVTRKIGDDVVGSVEIPRTWPTHGTTARLNVGEDGSPVSEAYSRPFRLKAANLRVVVELEGAVDGNPGAAYQAVLREQ